MFAKPTLVIYSFAPKGTPYQPQLAEDARQYLQKLWRGCDKLEITVALANSEFSTQFPEGVKTNDPTFRIVAAKTDPRRDDQAFLFEYQDVLGFMATLEAEENGSLIPWQQLHEKWITAVGKVEAPVGLMQEVYLFSALKKGDALATSRLDSDQATKIISDLGTQVMEALPGSSDEMWGADAPYITEDGYHIWEGEDLINRRALGLIAPLEKEELFFRWAVWPESPRLASFARYLVHAAKLRFAENTFERELPKIEQAARPLDQELKRLIPLYRRSESLNAWNLKEVKRAYNQLMDEQTRNFGLLFDITRLKELFLTTQIALRNMRNYVPPRHAGNFARTGGIFEEDRARGIRLRDQIKIDLGYLGALRERAQAGHRMVGLLLEQESQRTGHRLNSLILLQGSLLGSLTIGLLMLPAFEVFHDSRGLIWALTGLLMATAMAIPPLFARWHETYKWADRVVGGLFCAALFFFGVTVWEELHLPALRVTRTPYLVFKLLVSVIGFLLGSYVVQRLEKQKLHRRK
jgi:hypothetical protein